MFRGEHQRVHSRSKSARILHSRPIAEWQDRCEHEGIIDESLSRSERHEWHARSARRVQRSIIHHEDQSVFPTTVRIVVSELLRKGTTDVTG